MIIILTGMPAVGKSTIGKKVASKLQYHYIDLDKYIAKRCCCSINEIFQIKGESFFRRLESLALKLILKLYKKNLVLSLGGGTFIAEKNSTLCLQQGFVVWLKQPLNIMYNRIKKNNKRPLLQTGNLYNNLKSLLQQREPFYEKAHIHIISNKFTNSEIVKLITYEFHKRTLQ